MSYGLEVLDRIDVQNDPVNWIDPLGLHGIIFFGRGPFINRPSFLRGGRVPRPNLNRNPTPKPNPKPEANESCPLPQNNPPVELPKSWWGRLMDKLGGLDGSGGASGPPVIIDPNYVDSQT